GGGGDDQLHGDDGNDTLSGGTGTNLYDGGDGIDTADYSNEHNGVLVDLAGTFASIFHSGITDGHGNFVSTDTYFSIENVEGGEGNDFIIGTNDANVIDGNGGNDLLLGMGGNDTINGGDGDDMIEGGAGADTLDGGTGIN